METAQQQSGKIHAAILAVMSEIGAIGKTRENKQQNFKFRGIADALGACQPLFIKHKMYVHPAKVLVDEITEVTSKDGKAHGYHTRQRILYRAVSGEDGSFVEGEVSGEAVDFGDKCAGKVMSISFKYFLFQLFCIPEDDPDADPDGHSPQVGASKKPGAAQQPPQPKPEPSAKPRGPMSMLVFLLNQKGFDTPAKVLEWMGKKLDRKVAATKEVKPDEVARLTKLANEIPDLGTGPTE